MAEKTKINKRNKKNKRSGAGKTCEVLRKLETKMIGKVIMHSKLYVFGFFYSQYKKSYKDKIINEQKNTRTKKRNVVVGRKVSLLNMCSTPSRKLHWIMKSLESRKLSCGRFLI